MCLKKFKELINTSRYDLDNDLIVVNFDEESRGEKIIFLIKYVAGLIVNDTSRVGVLNTNIKPKFFNMGIINKQAEVNIKRNLSQQQKEMKIENIKNVIKSNLFLNYTTETTTAEIIEKCKILKSEKKRDFIIISNVDKITDFNEENKEDFYKRLELLSHQLEITIMLVI